MITKKVVFIVFAWIIRVIIMPMASVDIPTHRFNGNTIIAANHRSILDLFIGLLAFRKWRIYPHMFVRGDYFENPIMGPLLRSLGAIPAGRGYGPQAVVSARNVLESGGILALAPEGRIPTSDERTDGVAELKPGIGRLSAETDSPIFLVAMSNTDLVWRRGSRLPRPLNPFRRPTIRLSTEWLETPDGATPEVIVEAVAVALSKLLDDPSQQ